MNQPARANRFKPMVDPTMEINSLFRGFGLRPGWREFDVTPDIRVDVTEDADSCRIEAEVPGVDRTDIELSVENDVVSIGAEMKNGCEETAGETTLCAERVYGRTRRVITWPGSVDDSKVEARHDKGVLAIVWPKKANGHSRRVSIG